MIVTPLVQVFPGLFVHAEEVLCVNERVSSSKPAQDPTYSVTVQMKNGTHHSFMPARSVDVVKAINNRLLDLEINRSPSR